jgi:conflict system pore-forming effector with SLATT domain
MAQSDRQQAIAPRVVSSIEEAMAARRVAQVRAAAKARAGSGAGAAAVQLQPAEQLLLAMRTVKAARFNAAERLERKNTISLFAMSMVSLYFVGLSVWQAVYAAAIDDAANRLITLVSIMSSVFTLVLALIESMNDYRMKAHHMHACALAVNDLYHEFKLMPAPDAGLIQEFRHRYNEAVRGCPYNHSRIDYLMARSERGGTPWEEKVWVRLRYAFDVYALYALCLITPPLVLILCR